MVCVYVCVRVCACVFVPVWYGGWLYIIDPLDIAEGCMHTLGALY